LSDLQHDPEVLVLAERVVLALRGFGALNANRIEDEDFYLPPLSWKIEGHLVAMTRQLIAAGVINERDLLMETLLNQAVTIEQSLREAAERKHAETGYLVPGVWPLDGNNQG
jgi:hypothetical protein